MNRIGRSLPVLVVTLCLAACTYRPSRDAGTLAAKPIARAAPPPRTAAPSVVATRASVTLAGPEIERLSALVRADADRCFAVGEVRRRVVALVSELEAWGRQPNSRNAAAVEKSVQKYREVCAMNKMPVVALILSGVSLTACSSVDREIAALNAEERELATDIATLQQKRMCIERLITALEEYRRSSNARNSEALAMARQKYERTN